MGNNDKVGAVLFTDRVEKFIPPSKGRTHALRIVREIFDYTPQGKGSDWSCPRTLLHRHAEAHHRLPVVGLQDLSRATIWKPR